MLHLSLLRSVSPDDQSELPDPFVKILLHPDRPRRRKTESAASSLDPVWEESFSFTVPSHQLGDKRLELVVLDKKGLFSRSAKFFHQIIKLSCPVNLAY